MSRYKTVIGRGLRAWTLPAQKTEARVGCSVLNRMTRLGMPVSQRIARAGPGQRDRRIRWIARTRTIHDVKTETVYG